jgi:heat shock protein HslJ
MKAIVGFALFLLFLAGIAFVMLQGRQLAQLGAPGGGAGLTGVSWRPVTVGSEAIPEDSGMYIRFEVDGSIKGHGGCNGFFGSLEQSESGLEVGPLGSTRMACPEPRMSREVAFLEAVQKTRNFKIASDRMSLLDEGSSVLAQFVAGADN